MNFHTDDWIFEQLNKHYTEALKISTRPVIGVFLHGSQNYGLDFESSDIDTICLVLPSKEDILRASPPISFEHRYENNEHIVFWEIRHFLNLLEKGGFNQLEILNTKYYILNTSIEVSKNLFGYLQRQAGELKNLNIYRTANSFLGMMHRCVSLIEKSSKDIKKDFMRVNFFYNALKLYLTDIDFDKVINPENSDEIKQLKSIDLPQDKILTLSKQYLTEAKALINAIESKEINISPVVDQARYYVWRVILEEGLNETKYLYKSIF